MLKLFTTGALTPVIMCSVFLLLVGLIIFTAASPEPAAAAPDEEFYLTILHTNDEHGAVIPHGPAVDFHPERENSTVGGYARLASAVNEIRLEKEAAGEPVLILNGGDFIGGSPYSWLVAAGYAAELNIKQKIGYDAVVIGNHEYDYGPDKLVGYLEEAGYPDAHEQTAVLASNTTAPPDYPLGREGLYRKTHMLELENGLMVGFFGLIGKDAVSVTAPHEPVEFTEQHEAAREMVEELKQSGADMIIALTHSGVEEDRDLALDVHGIDVIVGGHCHTALEEPVVEEGTVIVQAGSLLEYLGRLDLAFNPGTGEVRIRNYEDDIPFLLALDHTYPLDPAVDELVGEYTEKLNELIAEKTGGRFRHVLDSVMLSDFEIPNHPPLQESPFGNFVTDAMRLVTEEKAGIEVDFAIQANGNIRGGVVPGSMPHSQGKVSFYDLAELIGLGVGPDGQAGYPVAAIYLTGEEMRRVLEVAVLLAELMGDTYFLQFSGLRYDYNPQNAVLFTVPSLDLPIPTTRAVTGAERYIGEGRQGFDDEHYTPLEWGDEELYCLVTDIYILSFLPMVGEMLPQLDLVIKDSKGNPVAEDDFEELIVYVNGEELKVWQSVIEYAANQPIGDSGLPEVDHYYVSTAERINPVSTVPFIAWLILILLVPVVLIVLLIRRRKRRKKMLTSE